MKNFTDKQRRAMFARINKVGASLYPVEVEFRTPSYNNVVVSGIKEVDITTPPKTDVPDWVSASVKQPTEEVPRYIPEADVLADYAKTIKPVDTSIQIAEDKSDVGKNVDDLLAQYAKNLPSEKKVVGAVKVDDEYAGGPVKLIVRSKVNKDLDELLNV